MTGPEISALQALLNHPAKLFYDKRFFRSIILCFMICQSFDDTIRFEQAWCQSKQNESKQNDR